MKNSFELNVDYYLENGFVIMTKFFHEKRGFCCGSGCLNCPYEPRHIKKNTKLKDKNDKKDQ